MRKRLKLSLVHWLVLISGILFLGLSVISVRIFMENPNEYGVLDYLTLIIMAAIGCIQIFHKHTDKSILFSTQLCVLLSVLIMIISHSFSVLLLCLIFTIGTIIEYLMLKLFIIFIPAETRLSIDSIIDFPPKHSIEGKHIIPTFELKNLKNGTYLQVFRDNVKIGISAMGGAGLIIPLYPIYFACPCFATAFIFWFNVSASAR